MPASAVIGRPASDVLQLPAEFADAARARELGGVARRRVEFALPRPATARQIELGLSAAHLLTPGGRRRLPVHVPGRHRRSRSSSATRGMQQRLAAVGEMAAGIAHEIRNPLASMSGSIQILRQELPLSDEQAQLMDIVLRESERLNDDDPIVPRLRAAAAVRRSTRLDVRPAAAATRRCCCATAPRCTTAHAIDVDVPPSRGLVRGRRGPDPADRLEPGDQRPARDAATAAGSRLAARARARRRAASVVLAVAGRGRRHRRRGARRHLPAVPRRVRAGHRPRPGDRAPHRQRLRRRDPGRPRTPGAGTTVRVRLPVAAPAPCRQLTP